MFGQIFWVATLWKLDLEDFIHLLSARRARLRDCAACSGFGASLASGSGGRDLDRFADRCLRCKKLEEVQEQKSTSPYITERSFHQIRYKYKSSLALARLVHSPVGVSGSSNGGMITDASFETIAEHALLKANIAKHTGDETQECCEMLWNWSCMEAPLRHHQKGNPSSFSLLLVCNFVQILHNYSFVGVVGHLKCSSCLCPLCVQLWLWCSHQGLERLKTAAQRFGTESKKVQANWAELVWWSVVQMGTRNVIDSGRWKFGYLLFPRQL